VNAKAEAVHVPLPTTGAAAPAVALPNWAFWLYILLVIIEYSGITKDIPALKAARVSTLLNYGLLATVIAYGGMRGVFSHAASKIFLTIVIITCLSVTWAIVRSRVINGIQPFVSYLVFFILTLRIVDRRKRMDILAVVFAGLMAYLVIRNWSNLNTVKRLGHLDTGYFMGDNNDFAWTLVQMIGIIGTLLVGYSKNILIKAVALGAIVICLAGIIGSGSRGGTLGTAAAMAYYWWFVSTRKVQAAAAVVIAVIGVIAFAPANYFDRMQSIESYEEDSSAMARLTVWKAAANMATDFPLGVGAGNFQSAYGRYYMAPEGSSAIAWASPRWLAAHSIKFRTLGEYGFHGLFLVLYMIY
jgi:putative inorganic carbon (hco3(-)) transporter